MEDFGFIDESLNGLDQSDPVLIKAIKEKFLVAPSTQPYNFSKPRHMLDLKGKTKNSCFFSCW